MKEPITILFAGIGGALISGVVAIVSSAISLRAARRQMENQIQERDRDRRHQVLLAILQRRHQAIESIWELLFVLESDAMLSERATEIFIRNLLWLRPDLQTICLQLLHSPDGRDCNSFLRARKALMDEASAIDVS